MATLIAVITVFLIALCIPLMFNKPHWVFYLFLFFKIFDNMIGGYIAAAGNLGLPRTWVPGDFMWILVLGAAMAMPGPEPVPSNSIRKYLKVIFVIHIFSVFQGMVFYFVSALTYSRVIHFLATIAFGLKYFTTYRRVNGLLKFLIVTILLMFIIHILIRFGIYTPPTSEMDYQWQLGGERGTSSLVPILYLVIIAIGVGIFASKSGSFILAAIALFVGAGGVLLAETRSTYGAAAIIIISMILFIKGRIKIMTICAIAGFLAIVVANAIGFDFLDRFKTRSGARGFEISTAFQGDMGRGGEYLRIASSYRDQPHFLLTGRGVGALHEVVTQRHSSTDRFGGQAGYYHSEYLGWLDRCGLIGLFLSIFLPLACICRGFVLSRCPIPQLQCYGIIVFAMMMSLMAEAVFHPTLSNERAAPIIICFAVILANWQHIYNSVLPQYDDYQYYFDEEGFPQDTFETVETFQHN